MHQLLTTMGYDLELDKFYAEALKSFGHYERPVVDLQEGEKSFKEAIDEIKAEKLKQNTEASKASLSTSNSTVTPVAAQVVDQSNNLPQVDEEEDLIKDDQPEENVTSNEDNDTQSVTATNYNFSQGTFSIDGIGQFNVTVSNNKANLEINGKQLKNVVYEPIDDVLGAEENCSRSFIFRQNKKDGISIQLTIENFSNKAA